MYPNFLAMATLAMYLPFDCLSVVQLPFLIPLRLISPPQLLFCIAQSTPMLASHLGLSMINEWHLNSLLLPSKELPLKREMNEANANKMYFLRVFQTSRHIQKLPKFDYMANPEIFPRSK